MKYAIKLWVDDGWMYVTDTDTNGNTVVVTYDTKKQADAVNFGVWGCQGRVVEYKESKAKTGNIFIDASNLVDELSEEEIEELRAKKQAIKEDLYDAVKMEMFKASSELEGIDMDDKQEKALDGLAKLSQQIEESRIQYEEENDAWWDGLTEKEREDAFYAVCKRIHQAELMDHGTYRHALYDVFGFDGGMYRHGMNCGFMAIHNAIGDGEDYQKMRRVTRFEVIDDSGRGYVKYLEVGEGIQYGLQDDDRTLKVFIDKARWREDWL